MKNLTLVAVLIALAIGPSCSSDDGPTVTIEPPLREQLTSRDDVLYVLRDAYNTGRIDEINKLLDDNFTFFFSAADVSQGNVYAPQWNRVSEIAATNNLFGFGQLPPGLPPVSGINVQIFWNDGADEWNPVTPDQQQYPGETWYVQNVDYFFTVVAGQWTFTSGETIKAAFTVRQAEVNGETLWRIVSWRDDDTIVLPTLVAGAGATENSTWGRVKSLFAEPVK